MRGPISEGGTSEEESTSGIGEVTRNLTGHQPENVNIAGSSLGTPVNSEKVARQN